MKKTKNTIQWPTKRKLKAQYRLYFFTLLIGAPLAVVALLAMLNSLNDFYSVTPMFCLVTGFMYLIVVGDWNYSIRFIQYSLVKRGTDYYMEIKARFGLRRKKYLNLLLPFQELSKYPFSSAIAISAEDKSKFELEPRNWICLKSDDSPLIQLFKFDNLATEEHKRWENESKTIAADLKLEEHTPAPGEIRRKAESAPLSPPPGISVVGTEDGRAIYSFKGGQPLSRCFYQTLLYFGLSLIVMSFSYEVNWVYTILVSMFISSIALWGLLYTNYYRQELELDGRVFHSCRKLGPIRYKVMRNLKTDGLALNLSQLPQSWLLNRYITEFTPVGFSDPRIGGPDAAAMYWLVCALHYELKPVSEEGLAFRF